MSTYIKGFKPPDEKWLKMKEVYDSCKKAGVDTPNEVKKFFNYEEPDDAGVEIDIKTHDYAEEMIEGFDVHLSEVPEDVKILRFYYVY